MRTQSHSYYQLHIQQDLIATVLTANWHSHYSMKPDNCIFAWLPVSLSLTLIFQGDLHSLHFCTLFISTACCITEIFRLHMVSCSWVHLTDIGFEPVNPMVTITTLPHKTVKNGQLKTVQRHSKFLGFKNLELDFFLIVKVLDFWSSDLYSNLCSGSILCGAISHIWA